MKAKLLFGICVLAGLVLFGGVSEGFAKTVQYAPDWESLDSRATPGWFGDAKFGIFIHWGVYSVPAWGPKGTYSEWYWRRSHKSAGELRDDVWGKFHLKNYGADFSYFDFAPKFTCEMYDPDQWADFFARSGAKYIVLTSKHHDGFCLWPSKEANKTWGREWNSVDAGPGRDLLGELTTSVRKRGIKMGYYYSFYEWFNPLYKSDVNAYVNEHMLPQMKDLVNRYDPDIVWPDGEWEHPDSVWRSQEFLAWLFNESAVKDTVVINDRWGKGARHHHGGYYTTEYGAGLKDSTHPWEECRGMGHSFGYNRNESVNDYRTGREMILMLVDLVSRGGNLLLDIGPTGDGRIPVIMQERLVQIGDWLKVNGEAIYGTTTWKKTCQWSEGKRPEQVYKEYKAKYNVLDVVGSGPKGDRAVKEIFFTSKDDVLYAIIGAWSGDELVVDDVKLGKSGKVGMLGREGELEWRNKGGKLVVDLGDIDRSELPCKAAWVFKIEGNIGH